MSSSVANNRHLQLNRKLILHIFPAQKLRLTSLFRNKNSKNIFGSELSETNNKPTFRLYQKILTKNREKIKKKNSKIIFGSESSEANNEPTIRWHQKIDKKSRRRKNRKNNNELTFRLHKMTKNREKKSKIIFGSDLSEVNNELTFRINQKIDKKSRKRNRKLFFVRYFWNE